ncbi:response regulator transcription factor [Chitinophaga sp. 22321]|uniref:Response regulator transcription factor n=1 Tax=Chitinophaga hostae TaxID=2831022 RepID=A0ABS5ISW1_9BACT|nr:response regulator transcription factor [Chitinophaga hostae]MBS0026048.1 response regulator transcription factor [Chitinophaga hostae]
MIISRRNAVTILYADDDALSARTLKLSLERAGNFEVVVAADGQEAWEYFNARYFDACLLDVHMPELDGVELAAKIRTINAVVPIVYISADIQLETKIKGFDIGKADDYCEKPIQIPVLVPKIQALVRRANEQKAASDIIALDKYIFNTRDCTLTYDGVSFSMKLNEVKVLKELVGRLNKTVSRDELKQLIAGGGKESSLYPSVAILRAHFRDSSFVEILTIQGIGYCLTAPKECVRYF